MKINSHCCRVFIALPFSVSPLWVQKKCDRQNTTTQKRPQYPLPHFVFMANWEWGDIWI